MTAAEYFMHARTLGAFTAEDCLAMARQASELDRACELSKLALPVMVWHETMPDGDGFGRFSRGITVY